MKVRVANEVGDQSLIYLLTDRNTVLVFNILLYEKIKFTQRRDYEIDGSPAGVVFILDPAKCAIPGNSLTFYLLESLN